MTNVLDRKFTTEQLGVNTLEIDVRVQREFHNAGKVEKIVREFNPSALGIIAVSRRADTSQVIIDGWHRWEAVRRLTDNTGTMTAHVFEGLSLAEEAQLFLDLNSGNQPGVMDKFRQRLLTGDKVAVEIDKITKHYGWKIQRQQGAGTIQAISTVEQIYRHSEALEEDPNVLQLVVLTLNRAWGNQKEAPHAEIMKGLAAMFSEYKDRLEVDRLAMRLSEYAGGPSVLLHDAEVIASARRMRTAMAVAEQITDWYNRGLRVGGPNILPTWRRSR